MSKKSLILGITILLFLLLYIFYWLNYFKVLNFNVIPLPFLNQKVSQSVKPQTNLPTPPLLSPPPPLPKNPPPPPPALPSN